MRKLIADAALEYLFAEKADSPCPEGAGLLRAFAGIPERGAFPAQYATCERCYA